MHFIDPVTVASWPKPNYDHPETRGHGISAVNIVLILAIVIFGVRCLTRLRISGGLGSDDFLLGAALIPAIGLSSTVLTAYNEYGWDRHVWDTRADQFRPGLKAAFATWIFFALTSALTKLSLLAFYLRLVPSTSRIYRWSLYAAMVIVIGLGFNNVLEVVLMCIPTQAIWDFVPPRYHPTYQFRCNNRGAVLFQSSVNNTIVDFALLLIPVPLIWTQRLFARQRLPLLLLFILGTIVCILGALKTGFIVDAYAKSQDQQWAAYPLWVTLLLEVDLGLIVVAATAIGPLLARHFPRYFDDTPREESIPDRSMQKAGSGFDRAVTVLTRGRSTRGFVPLEPKGEPSTPSFSKTDFSAETSYSAGGQMTDEKPTAQFVVVQDMHTGRMITSPALPKTTIKSTSERGVTREKVGLRAMLDEEDDVEKGFSSSKFKEWEDEGELAKWKNVGAAM